jgi:uncharacterized protein (TIGR03437 family)
MKWWVCLGLVLGSLWFPTEARAQTTTVTITTTPAVLNYSYQIGAATLPAASSVQIKRTGSGAALPFTVSVPGTAPWLIVTPTTGSTGSTISVRVNPTSLVANTYTATLTVTATGVADPAYITVTLLIKNPPPTMAVSSGTLTFTYTTDQGTALADQTVSVSTDGEPVSFTAVASGGSWLSITPALGIAVSGSPVTITASINTDGLLPGTYSGKITLTSPNASNKSLAVTVALTVSPGRAVISSIWPNSAPIGANDQTVTLRGSHFFKASVVTAGTTTLTTTWISTTAMLAVIPKALLATQGTINVTMTNSPQTASDPVVFTVTAAGPVIQDVVNAASFVSTTPPQIAPGEIISIFGSGMGPTAVIQATPTGSVYPTTLGSPAAMVEFELTTGVWTAAPIIFAQANQINAVAPFALTATTGLRLRVTYNSLTSTPVTFNGVTANPGLFTIDSSGRGQAAALNYDPATSTYSLNSSSNSAAKGGTIVFFGTGGGVTSPLPSADGAVVPTTGPVPTIAGTVSVTIGGEAATVQSATAVPGSIAGLMQLNVTVPATLKAAKDHSVLVTIGGQSSSTYATISVK